MNNKNIMKKSPADRIFLAAVYLFLALFVLVVIYPLVYVVSCSFFVAAGSCGRPGISVAGESRAAGLQGSPGR